LRGICEDEHVLTHPHDLRTYQSNGLLHYHVMPPVAVLPVSAGEVRDVIRVCHQLQGGRAVGRDKIDGGLIAVRRAFRCGDTDPLGWRSDARFGNSLSRRPTRTRGSREGPDPDPGALRRAWLGSDYDAVGRSVVAAAPGGHLPHVRHHLPG
jgi:hypothetical protein